MTNAFSLFFYLYFLSLALSSAFKLPARMPLPLSLVGGANLSAIIVCYLAVKQWDVETHSNSQLSISSVMRTRGAPKHLDS